MTIKNGADKGAASSPPALALARLMAWLSPVFPTGGFAYSAGLEQAVADELVTSRSDLQAWLEALLARGTFWNDAVLLAAAHRGETDVAALAAALAPSAQRHRESLDQGAAFLDAASAWQPHNLARETPLSVALGLMAARAGIGLQDTLVASLQTVVSNQCQAAIRLSVIGQTGAAQLMASLEPAVLDTATRAEASTLDDLGGSSFLADIAATRHETLEPRLFLS